MSQNCRMSLFLWRVGTVEIEQAWADFCKSESTHIRIWRYINEVIGLRGRGLRVSEATGDCKNVTTPFLRLSVSSETRIIMHVYEQGGVSVCTVVFYHHVCHNRCVLDTPFKRIRFNTRNLSSSEFLWSWQRRVVGSKWQSFRAAMPRRHGRRRRIFQAFALLSNVYSIVTKVRPMMMDRWQRWNGGGAVLFSCSPTRRIYVAHILHAIKYVYLIRLKYFLDMADVWVMSSAG
jgi:hypothetical protein